MSALLGSRLPLIAAPMAGGATTPELTAAAARAGAFPFIAAGYKTPEALRSEIALARQLGAPFGVNLFVPTRDPVDTAAFRAYRAELAPEAREYGLSLDPEPRSDDDAWREKLAMLIQRPVAAVSLTFGLPSPDDIAALQRVGTQVFATVTTAAEAQESEGAGVDALIVQGSGAGGHSATFDASRDVPESPTEALVGVVREASRLPVIAAGAVDGPEAVSRLLGAGAVAVVIGTLLLRADEAGTSATHRAALADPRFDRTSLTRAFTGRPARALRNGFVERHDATAPTAYPAVHHLTRELRQAAGRAGDADRVHLWAGTGYRSARSGPAAQIIGDLAREIA